MEKSAEYELKVLTTDACDRCDRKVIVDESEAAKLKEMVTELETADPKVAGNDSEPAERNAKGTEVKVIKLEMDVNNLEATVHEEAGNEAKFAELVEEGYDIESAECEAGKSWAEVNKLGEIEGENTVNVRKVAERCTAVNKLEVAEREAALNQEVVQCLEAASERVAAERKAIVETAEHKAAGRGEGSVPGGA